MSQYLWVNPDRLEKAVQEETVDGVKLVVEISPYQSPKRVRGSYLREKGLFEIRFSYIDDEPEKPPVTFGKVQVIEGQFTGKILRIILPIDSPPLNNACVIDLQTKARDALKARQQRFGGRVGQILNQKVAEEVIEHDLPELVGAT